MMERLGQLWRGLERIVWPRPTMIEEVTSAADDVGRESARLERNGDRFALMVRGLRGTAPRKHVTKRRGK